jgi:(2Fe-2S) ferredoxin
MPPFERHLFVCTNRRVPGHPEGEGCASLGSEALHAVFKEELARRGLKHRFRANKAGCLDACDFGPTVVVYPDGVWYRPTTPADCLEIIEQHLVGGRVVERLRMRLEKGSGPISAAEMGPDPFTSTS